MSDGLTRESFDRYLEHVFREREPRPAPTTTFDFELAAKHGIGFAWHGDTVLLSAEGMKRARELGVVKDVAPQPIPRVEMTAEELRDKVAHEGWDTDFVKSISPNTETTPRLKSGE